MVPDYSDSQSLLPLVTSPVASVFSGNFFLAVAVFNNNNNNHPAKM